VPKALEKLGPNATSKQKIVLLWDLVQSYRYAKTYSPIEMIKSRAMECALRDYVFFLLARKYLPEEIDVLSVVCNRHLALLVVEKGSLKDKDSLPRAYEVELTNMRAEGENESYGVMEIEDISLLKDLKQQYDTFGRVNELTVTNPQALGINAKEHVRIMGGFRGIKSVILSNNALSLQVSNSSRLPLLLTAIEADPKDSAVLNKVGEMVNSRKDDPLPYFLQGLHLNPRNTSILENLAFYFWLNNNKDPRQILDRSDCDTLTSYLQDIINMKVRANKLLIGDAQALLVRLSS
jgi:hypothetical protein